MHTSLRRGVFAASVALLSSVSASPHAVAQSAGSQGTVTGTITDPTGAVLPGASVTLSNPVSHLSRTAVTDSGGRYRFTNLPFSSYHLAVTAAGFANLTQDVDVRSPVPVPLTEMMRVGGNNTVVNVEADQRDLLNSDPTFQTNIDRAAFEKLPLESESSSLSSLVTLSSPGIAADSNGLFHGLGDHASNSFSIDGQSITDQQSKVFSNQLPTNAVQTIQVIDGAPPAEYGGKTSVVIDVTTRSGEGVSKPTGSVTASYGTFGSANASVDLAYGGAKWGNFFEIDGLNTGRFLDPPEFTVFHDKGNEFNFFDRVDRQLTEHDSVRFNANVSRSWFQTPDSYDSSNVQNVISGGATANPVLGNVGSADQRSKIVTFNFAPTYTRVVSQFSVLNFGVFVRRDGYNYYPSSNPLADASAPNLQNQSISQNRSLLNAGAHTDLSYVKGIHNIKIGAQYEQTFLNENDVLGIASPYFNSPCLDASGNSAAGYTDPSQCAAGQANPGFNPVLVGYDLTRGGTNFTFNGHTDVKELALYVEDSIKIQHWLLNLGIRGDIYNGLAKAQQAEPRLGVAYTIDRTGTVLRVSYARTLESPFNENLVLSSQGCGNDVLAPLLNCTPGVSTTLEPGFRNEFHAGLQQAFGKHLTVGGEYIWKYTHNAFDFSVLGNTPITFPIDWHNSKIPGFAIRTEVPEWHGVSAFNVMSSVAARFFPPQTAGAGATITQGNTPNYPFRIDHDEKFNQTTHVQYQFHGKHSPWFGLNWRYDSGLTAASTPCYNVTDPNSICAGTSTTLNGQPAIDLSGYTADEEFQAGLVCNGVKATPTSPIPGNVCLTTQLTSNLLSIPAPGTEDDDKNPQRIASRNVFDMSVGDDNLYSFHKDAQRISLRLTAVNLTNKYALYNFLSTFSGTHYLTPRALNVELGYHF